MTPAAQADPILVHIGYHKTGTTWFQRELFGRPPFRMPLRYRDIVETLVYPHDLVFDAARARAALDPALSAPGSAGRVRVLSCERLSGNPHSGGYDSRTLADRVRATLPEARVWIVVRNQVDAIASNYRQYVREGGTGTLAYYLKGDPPERVPSFSLLHFEYHRLVLHYRELFGPDRVLVSCYEDFARDPRSFVRAVGRFAGGEAPLEALDFRNRANASFSDASIALLRISNAFSYYPSMNQYPVVNLPGRRALRGALQRWDARRPARGPSALRRRVAQRVGGRFAASNRRLAALLGRDLGEVGYDV